MQNNVNSVSASPRSYAYTPLPPITVTVKDACRALGVKRTTLFGLLSQGTLQRVKIGRCTLVTTESMRNLVANAVDMPGER